MMSWYIYTHSNKAAHVLISNSILANRFTPDSFKCESLGFIGQEYIFATPLQLVEDLQQIGTDDIYAQTIYEWRGSNPEAILSQFVREYSAKPFMFAENYRATRLLTKATFGYLKNTYGIKAKSLPWSPKI